MATPSALVRTMTEALGLAKSTALVHDRNLTVAGLRSKHGRGRAAARVTPLDAARLLTAILASGQLNESVLSVERYAATRPLSTEGSKQPFGGIGIPELEGLPKDHSFIDALETLIALAANGRLLDALEETRDPNPRAPRRVWVDSLGPLIQVAALSPGTVGEIRIAGVKNREVAAVRYSIPSPWDGRRKGQPSAREMARWEAKAKKLKAKTGMERYSRVNEMTILKIGALLAPDEKVRP